MTDATTAIAKRIESLLDRFERSSMDADLTLGFYAEATSPETLANRMEATIRDIARDENREIVAIDLGGVLGTDDGYRCWGTLTMAAIGVTA